MADPDAVQRRPDDPSELTRLTTLEAAVAALAEEVRTRRLVVADDRHEAQLVGEIVGGQVELRLEIPGRPPGGRTALVLYLSTEADQEGLGLQVWANGNAVAAIDVIPDGRGGWAVDMTANEGDS